MFCVRKVAWGCAFRTRNINGAGDPNGTKGLALGTLMGPIEVNNGAIYRPIFIYLPDGTQKRLKPYGWRGTHSKGRGVERKGGGWGGWMTQRVTTACKR